MSRARAKPGRTLSNRPPDGESWVWMTNTMLCAITFRALGISARRVLDFLLHEHAAHAGQENGTLKATYLQLERWGVTPDDVRSGFEELFVAGFVRRTKQGLRVAGGGDPSTYRLTWLPSRGEDGRIEPPTHDWLKVTHQLGQPQLGSEDYEREHKIGVARAKAWLREQVKDTKRGSKKRQKPTPQVRVA